MPSTDRGDCPRKKGQFFILGALLLIILFFLGLPLIKPSLTSPSADLPFITRNLRLEFPAAFNLGLNSSNERGVMMNFSRFLNASLADNLIEFQALWVYSRNSTTSVNVTAGNFLTGNVTVNLTILTDDFEEPSRSLEVRVNQTNSTVFANPGAAFNITIAFGSRSTTVQWLRDKADVYIFFQLRRGQDIAVDEVSA